MMGDWNSREFKIMATWHRKLGQTMTVRIERLLMKLCLGQGKHETSMKAFETLFDCLTV